MGTCHVRGRGVLIVPEGLSVADVSTAATERKVGGKSLCHYEGRRKEGKEGEREGKTDLSFLKFL